jgi:hypothetical protein
VLNYVLRHDDVWGGVDAQIHVFLASTVARGEWSASLPGRFTPREEALSTHWIGGRVGPTAGLDKLKKWKFLPQPGLELRPFGRSASRYTHCANI